MRYFDPQNDVAFKKIFADEKHSKILIHFLNSVLDLKDPIKEIQILKNDQIPERDGLKETSLDLKAKDEADREFIIEMQVEKQKDFVNRSLYYASTSYSNQIESGEFYNQLNPVIFLGILNFNLFEGEDSITQHRFINQKTGKQDIDHMELNFIELPKFNKSENQCTTLADKWIYFLKNAKNLEIIPASVDSEEIKEAYTTSEKFVWTKSERELFESRARKVASHKDSLDTAKKEGMEKGREKGREEGMEKALEKMIKNGMMESEAKKILEL